MGRKRRAHRTLHPKVGLPPGAAVYVGEPREGGATSQALVYDANGLVEHTNPRPADVKALVGQGRVVWLDVDGVHDVALVSEVCELFGVHLLAAEDVMNTSSRPKLDVYDNHQILLALDMVRAEGDLCEIHTEHVTFITGPGFVLSFQEGTDGDPFDPVRHRIRNGTGRIRALGCDYLLHALVDSVVDGYFVVLDQIEDRIDTLESEAFTTARPDLPARVYAMKSDLSIVRRAVFPLREAVSRMVRGETPGITPTVEPYLRDLADHILQALDMIESGRDRLTTVLEVYLAAATHRMNDVMKVLTVASTIFMPLSWIAGIYGMNFDVMPELHWAFGYPTAVGSMITVAVGMLIYFWRRGWL